MQNLLLVGFSIQNNSRLQLLFMRHNKGQKACNFSSSILNIKRKNSVISTPLCFYSADFDVSGGL